MQKKGKSVNGINLLLQLIREAYNHHAWFGTNLRGSIRGLTAQQAAWRPSKNRHNIWEIVVHAAYWKYIVRRRLLNEKRGSFPLKGSNWIKRPIETNEQEWKKDIRLLEEIHGSLCNAISRIKPSQLKTRTKGSKFTNFDTIIGIACHDIYHAGQIQLLKRLMKR
jgi:uncharacterized damage-inducible protein DinB